MKKAIPIVLVVIIVVMGYMLMVSFPKQAKTQCEAVVKTTVTAQVTSAVQQCQQTLQQLMQIPACASAVPVQ